MDSLEQIMRFLQQLHKEQHNVHLLVQRAKALMIRYPFSVSKELPVEPVKTP